VVIALVCAALANALPDPSEATVIYYNARMAMREDRPLEAAKLWLLRNALEQQTARVSPYDADFHSVTWAALGELGICQDGHPTDEAGAGLWPLALHNQVVLTRTRKQKARRPRPFDGFQLGRQQRFISVGDVLSAQELRTVQLFRGRCARPHLAAIAAGEAITADLSERAVGARVLQHLLEQARTTLVKDKVRGLAAIDARLFDVRLQLAALAAQEARREMRDRARRGRQLGFSREAITVMREDAPATTLDPDSESARILRACVDWPVDEWMAIEPERRRFLFQQARTFGADPAALDRVALGLIDRLTSEGDGEQVTRWIAHRDPGAPAELLWQGERGQRLLGLDRESGFREHAVLALHRGVYELEGGDLPSALRSLALAVQLAPDSSDAETTRSLALRWLSYVAAQFEIGDALLVTLQQLVPARDYAVILEDLLWGAAFRADAASFDRGLAAQVGRGALERRLALLAPLARGDAQGFVKGLREGLQTSPTETLRFLDQLVQRLELEDADVRASQLATLVRARDLLVPLAQAEGRQGRRVTDLLDRTQAIAEGLGGLPSPTDRDRARALDPSGAVFAGSVRLAPSDALPWPFREEEVAAPSIFTPLELRPVEWRDADGVWVFGWSIRG
jgi:hypothetical protein